jgi:hypothetical protein
VKLTAHTNSDAIAVNDDDATAAASTSRLPSFSASLASFATSSGTMRRSSRSSVDTPAFGTDARGFHGCPTSTSTSTSASIARYARRKDSSSPSRISSSRSNGWSVW